MTPEEIRKREIQARRSNQVATAVLTAGSFVPAFQGIFNILSQTADSGLVYGIAVIDRLQNIDRQIQETVEDLAQSRVCQAR
jgi:hypothetical protein